MPKLNPKPTTTRAFTGAAARTRRKKTANFALKESIPAVIVGWPAKRARGGRHVELEADRGCAVVPDCRRSGGGAASRERAGADHAGCEDAHRSVARRIREVRQGALERHGQDRGARGRDAGRLRAD